MKDLEKLMNGNKKEDGTFDWEKIEAAINKEENDLVAKAETKGGEKGATEAITKFLKDLGYDDKAKFDTDFKAMKASHEAIGGKDEEIKNLSGAKTALEREKLILQSGVPGKDADYVMFQVNKRVTDDVPFEKAFEEFKAENAEYFKNPVPVFGAQTKSKEEPGSKEGFEKILEERNPDVKF